MLLKMFIGITLIYILEWCISTFQVERKIKAEMNSIKSWSSTSGKEGKEKRERTVNSLKVYNVQKICSPVFMLLVVVLLKCVYHASVSLE